MADADWQAHENLEFNPQVRHERIANQHFKSGSNSMTEVKDFIGKSISVPSKWVLSSKERLRDRMRSYICPTDDAVLTLFERDRSLDLQSKEFLDSLLSSHDNHKGAKVLLPAEIKNISGVLGISSIGDNQIVNPKKPPDPQAPAFHLFSAQVISVNGRNVLEAQGNFVTRKGDAGRQYRGIFVASRHDNNDARVREYMLDAADMGSFLKQEAVYRQGLRSIEW